MNSLQVNLENIHTNSQDLPYGFTTGELHRLVDKRSMFYESDPRVGSASPWTTIKATYIANNHNKFYKGLADPSISVPDYFKKFF